MTWSRVPWYCATRCCQSLTLSRRSRKKQRHTEPTPKAVPSGTLPRLRDGDWLMFPYAGAYTIASASNYTKGAFLQPVRLFLFSCKADKGWGNVLPQAAVVSMLSIPHTIPERDMREHEDEVAVDEDDGHQPGSCWSENGPHR
ncbi:hypothetical protein OEZ85_004614 [Tetradesmus obliquus]|uniref:Orn/DAP/Arg decarboxylase 2 C-terminal domain-containing protein n=1 Tax=Tetradesmus obliquus TaxID=3088 RepID=A0ABY8UPI6_TETOB|nr:hypothetical protein OEZ85_004614 [Tetradesmus obliquus]